jgi:tetratricopeptide (TPR) repeat protein
MSVRFDDAGSIEELVVRSRSRWYRIARRSGVAVAGFALALVGCAGTPDDDADGHDHAHTQVPRRVVPEGAGAPLFNDLGDYGRPVTTSSELAQSYFDQGLILAYGFNHAEAHRSFAEASKQDPGCALCAWGEAYVLGPNINKPMDDADVPTAWEATQRALAAQDGASPVERDLIDALAKRYAAEAVTDRMELDLAYAEAMRSVAAKYPDDLDVQTLFAEAVMDTMPWDYYVDPANPRPATFEVLAALESVMERNPDHPGALHLYIHAVEPSTTPDRGEKAADRLGSLSPGAGHLVHMPSHIYLRVGRYHDASSANEKAATADESYITQCRAQGFYPAAYYPHNVHFLYASAAFEGRSAVSIGAARKLSANMTPEMVAAVPIVEEFVPMELYALARFGRWEELSAAEAPPTEWRYATGAWHFGRGMAAAARGDLETARAELDSLRSIGAEPALAELYFASGSTPAQLLAIAGLVLQARIAGEAGHWNDAIPVLEEAVTLQDALPYTEPPPWYFPNREALGHALLQAKRPADAEAVFTKQLDYTPRNGWSLRGLADSQRAQGKTDAANATEQQLREVWQRADIEVSTAVL